MNPANFRKMAHGDIAGLRELAIDFFNDTRRQLSAWRELLESEDFNLLRANLHRCRGGASIFGLERIVALIGSLERASALEESGFDFEHFEMELSAAEDAVLAMTD